MLIQEASIDASENPCLCTKLGIVTNAICEYFPASSSGQKDPVKYDAVYNDDRGIQTERLVFSHKPLHSRRPWDDLGSI